MKRKQQLSFLPRQRLEHGGAIRESKRKEARPIDSKRPIHVVLRSTRAKGKWSLLHHNNKGRVHTLAYATAARCSVRLYQFANVGNHLHMLAKAPSRKELQRFLRILPGALAFAVTGAKKGNPVGRFWDKLAYSRVLHWGREFESLKSYLAKNVLEGLGVLKRAPGRLDPQLRSLMLAGVCATGPPKQINYF